MKIHINCCENHL